MATKKHSTTRKRAVDVGTIDYRSPDWGAAFARHYLEHFRRDPNSVALGGYLEDATKSTGNIDDTKALNAFGEVIQGELEKLTRNAPARSKEVQIALFKLSRGIHALNTAGLLMKLAIDGKLDDRYVDEDDLFPLCGDIVNREASDLFQVFDKLKDAIGVDFSYPEARAINEAAEEAERLAAMAPEMRELAEEKSHA
jgi:hypothetical protein